MEKRYSDKILTIVLALLTLFVGAYLAKNGFDTISLIIIAASVVLLIVLLLFQDLLDKLFQNIGLKIKNNYTDYIFESLKTSLEYLDVKGEKVAYYREDYISKLSLKKSKRFMKFPVYLDKGEIVKDQTYSIKSSVGFISNTSLEFKVYFNDKDVYNKQHYSSYSSIFKNSFLKKKDRNWIIKTENFCRFFQFILILPEDINNLKFKILKRKRKIKNDTSSIDTDWKETKIPYMRVKRYGKPMIRFVIIGFTNRVIYKIVWDFD